MSLALALWLEARAALRALDVAEHPDLTDRYGRTWVWKDGDLYVHDGLMAWTSTMILRQDIGLPAQSLARNPNYAGLCGICRQEWKDTP